MELKNIEAREKRKCENLKRSPDENADASY